MSRGPERSGHSIMRDISGYTSLLVITGALRKLVMVSTHQKDGNWTWGLTFIDCLLHAQLPYQRIYVSSLLIILNLWLSLEAQGSECSHWLEFLWIFKWWNWFSHLTHRLSTRKLCVVLGVFLPENCVLFGLGLLSSLSSPRQFTLLFFSKFSWGGTDWGGVEWFWGQRLEPLAQHPLSLFSFLSL